MRGRKRFPAGTAINTFARLSALLIALGAGIRAQGQEKPDGGNEPTPAAQEVEQQGRVIDSAALRNENVAVYEIDNDALKEANSRLGNDVTIVSHPAAEVSNFATEHGRPAGEPVVLSTGVVPPVSHGELFWWHQNSVFNARTFFQVGPVQPSRRNGYGGRYTGALRKFGDLTLGASQTKIRGMVNGNVLVPLPSERTPLTADPSRAAIVEKFLAAYPEAAPNRLDFDPRALNTNAPQRIDSVEGDARLDREAGSSGRVSLFYSLSRNRIDAFQFVAGQNPDNEIHAHIARIAYRRAISPATGVEAGFGFQRAKSVLLPEPNAVGPRVRIGHQIEDLGPDSQYPIDRAENTFRGGVLVRHQSGGGRHELTLGGDLSRFQLNGIETSNQRGQFEFSNNFGRTAIENFLHGIPSQYEVTVGGLARGFRNTSASVFVGDLWRLHPRLQIYAGLRYELETAPVEVNGMDRIPYGCDCNNFGPRFSFALRTGAGWVTRGSYTLSYGRIPPVTYQQVRNNPPHVRYIQVQNPSLTDPLKGADLNPQGRYSPLVLSPDLVSPYAHQYNVSLEREVHRNSLLRLGYVGSRTLKTINSFTMNRAEPVPGMEWTTKTVDQRRPDSRFYDVKQIVNGGIAYLDAAQISLDMRPAAGLTWGASYTFGKAIDTGADYAATAANRDLSTRRHQWQYESFRDRKGLSSFDSTHSLEIHYFYDLPATVSSHNVVALILNGWQISGATLLKSGSPFTVYLSSDSPGYGNVDGVGGDRPNILDPSILGKSVSHPNTATQILRRDRFAPMAPGDSRGNLGTSTFRKDGIANFNAALSKQWRWGKGGERTALLRAEAYNLTNHPQFDHPQTSFSSSSFGRITNTMNDGRVFQLSLRFML